MDKKINSFEDFLMHVGGYKELADRLDTTVWAVAKWKQHGIARVFWPKISRIYDITIGELYSISEKAKKDSGWADRA